MIPWNRVLVPAGVAACGGGLLVLCALAARPPVNPGEPAKRSAVSPPLPSERPVAATASDGTGGERSSRMTRTLRDFQSAKARFQKAFHAEAAGAALRFLDPFLGAPGSDPDDKARTYAALEILAGVYLRLAHQDEEAGDFAPYQSEISARLHALLSGGTLADPEKALLVGHIGLIPHRLFVREEGADGVLFVEASLDPLDAERATNMASEGNAALRDETLVKALLSLAKDAGPERGLSRDAALQALASRPELLDRDGLIAGAAGDPDPRVRTTCVALLAARPGPIEARRLLEIVEAQREPTMKAAILARIGPSAAGDPEIVRIADRLLSNPAEAAPREESLRILMARYEGRRDPAALAVIADHLARWSGEKDPGYSPIRVVAAEAASGNLRSFIPWLERLAAGPLTKAERRYLLDALDQLDPRQAPRD